MSEEEQVIEIREGKSYSNGNGSVRKVTRLLDGKVSFEVVEAPHMRGRFCKGTSGSISLGHFQKWAKEEV